MPSLYTLFITVPVVVVITTMGAWVVVLLVLVPSFHDHSVLPFGGVIDVPMAARFVSSIEFVPITETSDFTQFNWQRGPFKWDALGALTHTPADPFGMVAPTSSYKRILHDQAVLKDMLVFDLDHLEPSRPNVATYARHLGQKDCHRVITREAFYLNKLARLQFDGTSDGGGSIDVRSDDDSKVCLYVGTRFGCGTSST